MKRLTGFIASLGLLAASSAQAVIIDFVDLTENTLGETAWTSLNLGMGPLVMAVTGTQGGNNAYAYLDNSHAGLGVCGKVHNLSKVGQPNLNSDGSPSGSNNCNPGSDDNVTGGSAATEEILSFVFNMDVNISRIWLNNTHDADRIIDASETVKINGTSTSGVGNGYAPDSPYNGRTWNGQVASVANALTNGGAGWDVDIGSMFTIGYGDEQFYVSAIEILDPPDGDLPPPELVPAPATLLLFATGLFGLGMARRQRKS